MDQLSVSPAEHRQAIVREWARPRQPLGRQRRASEWPPGCPPRAPTGARATWRGSQPAAVLARPARSPRPPSAWQWPPESMAERDRGRRRVGSLGRLGHSEQGLRNICCQPDASPIGVPTSRPGLQLQTCRYSKTRRCAKAFHALQGTRRLHASQPRGHSRKKNKKMRKGKREQWVQDGWAGGGRGGTPQIPLPTLTANSSWGTHSSATADGCCCK
jgi:hypothetical protein